MKTGLFFFLWLSVLTSLFAQQKKIESLSQFNLGIAWVPVLHVSPSFLDYTIDNMTRFTLGVNYLNGYIKVNTQYANMIANKPLPSCVMLDNSLAYQYHFYLPNNFSIYLGGQVGLNTIKFEYNNYSKHRIYETELSTGAEIGLQKKLFNKIGIHCSFKLLHIFATPRNDINTLDVGFTYFFKPNNTLKTWLE
jgi:hypothetical protein